MHKTIVEIYPQETKNNGLAALYLAFTTSLITVLVVEPSRYKGNYNNKVKLKYVSEFRKFSYYYGLCFMDAWAVIYSS